jgi:hypothetical protein
MAYKTVLLSLKEKRKLSGVQFIALDYAVSFTIRAEVVRG